MIKIGNTTPSDFYVGNTPVQSIYYGQTLVWGRPAPVVPDSITLNGQESLSYQYDFDSTVHRNVTVTSTGAWTVNSKPDWVILSVTSGVSGDSVDVSCHNNTGVGTRTGSVVFKCGEDEATISISQYGKTVTLSVTPTSWTVGYSSNRESFDISSNGSWVADTGGSTWITIHDPGLHEGDYNGFEISVTANDSTSSREGTVVFVSTEDSTKMVNVPISQAGISVQASIAIKAKNWYNDDTGQYVNHQSWQVKFIGGSTGHNIHGVKVWVMDSRNGNQIGQPLVSEQDVSVNANQTLIWGLDDNKINDPSEYQLSYNASDAAYYQIMVTGNDGGANPVMFTQAKF